MKKKLFSVFLIFVIVISLLSDYQMPVNAADKNDNGTIRVLFVGNSFTRRNNLHKIFKGIAKADGKKVKTKRLAYGGYRLKKYASKNTRAGKEFRKLLKKDWDYVVIQGHSAEFVTRYYKESYSSLKTIIEMVRDNGAEPVLYMTWSKESGLEYTRRGDKLTLDRDEMTLAVSDAYNKLGNEFGIKVAPVGQNFLRCRDEYPEIDLFKKDRKHPKYAGSYLSACTIYETIFDKSVMGVKYYNSDEKKVGIGKKKATKLQLLADVRMSIDKNRVYLLPGSKTTVKAEISFSEDNTLYSDKYTGNKKDIIKYKSLSSNICSVNSKTGEIKALNPGTGYVRAESMSGLSRVVTVKVRKKEAVGIHATAVASTGGEFSNNIIGWNSRNNEVFDLYGSIGNENHFVRLYHGRMNYYVDKRKQRGRLYLYRITSYRKVNNEYEYSGESNVTSVIIPGQN